MTQRYILGRSGLAALMPSLALAGLLALGAGPGVANTPPGHQTPGNQTPGHQTPGKQAVVFDIDGTLTPQVYAIGTPRTGAAAAASRFAEAGIDVIYLTARIPFFQPGLEDWLADNGFPPGPLHMTQTEADQDDHAGFKTGVLESYAEGGWRFVAAFGDSSTDFQAYAAAGVPGDRIFALRRFGAFDCKDGVWAGCFSDWARLRPVIDGIIGGPG